MQALLQAYSCHLHADILIWSETHSLWTYLTPIFCIRFYAVPLILTSKFKILANLPDRGWHLCMHLCEQSLCACVYILIQSTCTQSTKHMLSGHSSCGPVSCSNPPPPPLVIYYDMHASSTPPPPPPPPHFTKSLDPPLGRQEGISS